jgi:hypothetical protein
VILIQAAAVCSCVCTQLVGKLEGCTRRETRRFLPQAPPPPPPELDSEEEEELELQRQVWEELDEDGSGTLDQQEVSEAPSYPPSIGAGGGGAAAGMHACCTQRCCHPASGASPYHTRAHRAHRSGVCVMV